MSDDQVSSSTPVGVVAHQDPPPPPVTQPGEGVPEVTLMQKIRQMRNLLLSLSDYTQLMDSAFLDSQKVAWKTYRQLLRDLPAIVNVTKMSDVVWPEMPKGDSK